ncbi:hotdog fold thioesterase [Kineosporia sp. J2-2]|uniref:Hotdog fold thioesterase n=1 Tax=Kineosporia corallincola TaxID=2835133 RepID=A0ABS5TCW1_9ACTN|nr:hotdog fold thioesterase [Kineosporia corallincola]MBT0768876.1 hotdog fold thioesterase [Kineosporia corallincola]
MSDNLDSPTAGGAVFAAALHERMGIELVEATARRTVATMPVEGNTQPFGLLHGGASAVLAETVGSVAANVHAGTMGLVAVGLEISATHHRGVRSGVVTGTAEAVHLGRSTATYEIAITDEAGRRVCSSRLTCMLLPDPAKKS